MSLAFPLRSLKLFSAPDTGAATPDRVARAHELPLLDRKRVGKTTWFAVQHDGRERWLVAESAGVRYCDETLGGPIGAFLTPARRFADWTYILTGADLPEPIPGLGSWMAPKGKKLTNCTMFSAAHIAALFPHLPWTREMWKRWQAWSSHVYDHPDGCVGVAVGMGIATVVKAGSPIRPDEVRIRQHWSTLPVRGRRFTGHSMFVMATRSLEANGRANGGGTAVGLNGVGSRVNYDYARLCAAKPVAFEARIDLSAIR